MNYGKTYFTSGILAPYWLFLLGGLFVAVTLLLPRGIVGTLRHWLAERRQRAAHAEAAHAGAAPAVPAQGPAE